MVSVNEQAHIVGMAHRYKQYLSGYAYIPLQDMSKYEQAYKVVYGNSN